MKYVQLKLVVEYNMVDGTWNNDDGNYFDPSEWDRKPDMDDPEVLHEAMLGAYTFLMSPRWVTLRRLGFEPKIQLSIIDTLIKYFVDLEQYERCADLVKVQKKIKLRYQKKDVNMTRTASSVSGSDKGKSTDDI